MLMTFGKFKGRDVNKLPRYYLEWLANKADLHGPLQIEVFKALGKPTPKQPKPETIEEIQDRTIREVMQRFAERERHGEQGDCDVNVTA